MHHTKNIRILVFVVLILSLFSNAVPATHAQSEVKIEVLSESISIYAGPGSVYPVIGSVAQSGRIILSGVSSDGAWYMFAYANGQGWISSDPALTKVISGNAMGLPIVEADTENAALDTVNATPVPSGFSRAQLDALTGKISCAKRSMIKPLTKIANDVIAASDRLDEANPDSYIVVLEGILNSYRATSDISNCLPTRVLCEGVAGRDGCYFEYASIVRSGLNEALIAALYTKADQSGNAQFHATRATILFNRWLTLADELYEGKYKGIDAMCTKKTASTLETGVKGIYIVLDGEFGTQLDSKSYDEALKTLEQLRIDWTKIGSLESCDSKLVKLTGLVDTLLDETFIAALYLKLGNTAMFTKHARLGVNAAQYINGLIAG
jgi:hypothetical protein